MKTDRELLEAAAKAAGYPPEWRGSIMVGTADGEGREWNPLTDDGDALRLAVILRINIEHMQTMGGKDFGINCWPVGRGDCCATEEDALSDYAAATRRAIVRAAAAIGDGKEGPSEQA